MPMVSVIVPCYNQAHFLPESIGSVLAQTFADWECVIVNDGSPDNTREVAMSLAANDPRIRYVEQKNRGLSGARNRGIDEAKGNYIQFLDSDDVLHPEKLEIQLEVLRAQPGIALSFCDYYFCSADDVLKRVSKGHDFEHPKLGQSDPIMDLAVRWETDLSIPIHCFLFDARLLMDNNIRFDEKLSNHEDWDCWMRIFRLRPLIVHVPRELAAYRQHRDSMITNQEAMWRGYDCAIRKQLDLCTNDRDLQKALKQKLKQISTAYRGKPMSQSEILAKQYRNIVPWPIQVLFRKLTSRLRK